MLAQKFEIQAASATQETASMHSGEGTHLFTSASEPFGPMQAYLGEGVEMFTYSRLHREGRAHRFCSPTRNAPLKKPRDLT